jgi:hypothetical protein
MSRPSQVLIPLVLAGWLTTGRLPADDPAKADVDPLKYAAVTVLKVDPKAGEITVKYRVNDKGEEPTRVFRHSTAVRLLDETGRAASLEAFEAGTEVLILETGGRLQEVRRYAHVRAGHRLSDAVTTLIEMAGGEDGSVDEVQRIYDLVRKLDPAGTGRIDPAAVRVASDRIVADRVAALIRRLDGDNDGSIARAEARGVLKEHFDKLDPNRDGRIDREELLRAAKARRDAAPGQAEGR